MEKQLFKYIKNNDISKVKQLIENGVNINAIDDEFNTPLHIAISNNFNDIAIYLIQNGANLKIDNFHFKDPVQIAIINKNLTLLKYILSIGFKFTYKSFCDFSYLDEAISSGHLEIVKYLIEEQNMNVNQICCRDGATPLLIAVICNEIEIIKYLIQLGADLNQTDHHGWSPLHFAIEKQFKDIIIILLEHGVDINGIKPNELITPLMRASTINLEITLLLLDSGADYTLKSKYGQTLFDFAKIEFELIIRFHIYKLKLQELWFIE